MSILVVQLVPEGLLFGADRNITAQLTMRDGSVEIVVTGQTQRPKVLKWPNREVIVGYVGAAEVEGQPTDQWLYAFIGRQLDFPDLETVAQALNDEFDALYHAGDFGGPMILHLGGFEQVDGEWTPRVYFIHNTTALHPDGLYEVGDSFACREELGPGGVLRLAAWPRDTRGPARANLQLPPGLRPRLLRTLRRGAARGGADDHPHAPEAAAPSADDAAGVVEARRARDPRLRRLLRRFLSRLSAVRRRRRRCRLGKLADVTGGNRTA